MGCNALSPLRSRLFDPWVDGRQIQTQVRMDFIKLNLDADRSGAKCVVTQRATAEYFGWDKAFPEFHLSTRYRKDGSAYTRGMMRKDKSLHHGGVRLRICRVASTTGHPAGKTHCFRMIGCWSRKHLVQLAEVAGDKFEWMEDACMKRVPRAHWLALASRVKPPAS